jgi:outer membrane receptor protein involved in Fe transport
MNRTILFLCLATIFNFSAFAQGTVSGTITDESLGDPLIGASVYLESDGGIGTTADFDGNYQLSVPAGTHNLIFSYIGYQDKKIEGVVVKEGETITLNILLSDNVQDLNLDIVVVEKAIERNEVAILMKMKKSEKIQEVISSQELSRFNVGNVAGAMQKVSGASVIDGKYVFVRGLGDRYTIAQLNGLPLPSIDPYKNTIQLDLIPANVVENISVSKTFSPDQPGNFTGGIVDVNTKSLPERPIASVTVGLGYNTFSTFNNSFLSQDKGGLDWLGFNNGTHDLPGFLTDPSFAEYLVPNAAIKSRNNDEFAANVDRVIKAMPNDFLADQTRASFNRSINFTLGDQIEVGGRKMGLFLSGGYSNQYQHYNVEKGFNQYVLPGQGEAVLKERFELNDTQSSENPTVNALAGLSYDISDNNRISFLGLYNHNTTISSRFLSGEFRRKDIEYPSVYETHVQNYLERSLINAQVVSENNFPSLNNAKLTISGFLTESNQDQPDLRFLATTRSVESNIFILDPSSYAPPTHFTRFLNDSQLGTKLDFTLPILQEKSKANKIKVGGLYSTKTRDFAENRYAILNRNGELYDGTENYFDDSNSGLIGEDENGRNLIGLFVDDNSLLQNAYDGTEKIAAAYAMATYEIVPKLKFIGGARVENTDIFVESRQENMPDSLRLGSIENTKVLPSVNFVYALTPDINLRASYSQTLGRPNMRELAPFFSFPFEGAPGETGNTQLQQTDITNYDLRFEYFPNPGEIIAVSLYYKHFQNPIIYTFRDDINPTYTWDNVPEADVYGVELEVRKSLGFIAPAIKDWRIGTNLSILTSNSTIPEDELVTREIFFPGEANERPFFGQSNFLVNAFLNYYNRDLELDFTTSYNYFGDRLNFTGKALPDIYERGRHGLEVSIKKSFLQNKYSIKLAGSNLLNPDYELFGNYNGQDYSYQRNQLGRTYSMSFTYNFK